MKKKRFRRKNSQSAKRHSVIILKQPTICQENTENGEL